VRSARAGARSNASSSEIISNNLKALLGGREGSWCRPRHPSESESPHPT
jgi:hypothetical protein